MAWPKPDYSKSQVRKAGQVLLKPVDSHDDFFNAYLVIDNWRASHGYPINTFQATLRSKLKIIDPHALVSQRLKRMLSILNKLHRFPSMSLDRMQDFDGLRTVVGSVSRLRALEKLSFYQDHRLCHVHFVFMVLMSRSGIYGHQTARTPRSLPSPECALKFRWHTQGYRYLVHFLKMA